MLHGSWAQKAVQFDLADLNRSSSSYLKQVNRSTQTSQEKDHLQTKTHLPFFCAAEAKWDKKSKTKLRFRLGSQEYVDRLEGKLD